MTKKDYIIIARIIRDEKYRINTDKMLSYRPETKEVLRSITQQFIRVLRNDNPKFNETKFNEFIGVI